jgi:hypothetical protein
MMIEKFDLSNTKIEGDRNSWHIRLQQKCEDIEVWVLFNGEQIQSSGMPKDIVQQWRDDELRKESQQ